MTRQQVGAQGVAARSLRRSRPVSRNRQSRAAVARDRSRPCEMAPIRWRARVRGRQRARLQASSPTRFVGGFASERHLVPAVGEPSPSDTRRPSGPNVLRSRHASARRSSRLARQPALEVAERTAPSPARGRTTRRLSSRGPSPLQLRARPLLVRARPSTRLPAGTRSREGTRSS